MILVFLRNLVAITYSAIGGRSKKLLDVMVLHMEYGFVVGTLVGLFWTMAAVVLGTRAQTVYSLVTLPVGTLFWRKIMIMYFTTNIKPSSSRQSIMAV